MFKEFSGVPILRKSLLFLCYIHLYAVEVGINCHSVVMGGHFCYKSRHLKMMKSFDLAISSVEIYSVEDMVSTRNYLNIDHSLSYNIDNMQGGS